MIPRAFFERATAVVARELLGQRLVRILDGQRLSPSLGPFTAGRDLLEPAERNRLDRAISPAEGRPGPIPDLAF